MLKFIRSARVPLFLLAVLLVLEVLSRTGIFPPGNQWALLLKGAIVKYGLAIVGPLAFFENLASFNVYFPGSIVILTTMALSAGDPGRAMRIFWIYYVCALLAYQVDYAIGIALRKKVGAAEVTPRYIESSRVPLWMRFAVFFVHPQLASILAVQVGSEGRGYKEIMPYMLLFTLVWPAFWSVLMYSIGNNLHVGGSELQGLAYLYVLGWLAFDVLKSWRRSRRSGA